MIIKRIFPILAYHRVRPDPQYGIDVSCKKFEEEMSWLSSEGYRTISLKELYNLWLRKERFPAKSVLITFDDGHHDVITYAHPILKKHGFRATLFVNTALLGKRYWVRWNAPAKSAVWSEQEPDRFGENPGTLDHAYEFMTWDEVRKIGEDGMDIESHGVEHPFLTTLSDAELQRQLEESKRQLTERLGRAPEFFCYPSGDYDARVKDAVRRAGYKAAVQTPSPFDLKDEWDDPFSWNRIGVGEYVQFWKFKGLLSGWYLTAYHAMPSPLWNALRFLWRQGPASGGGHVASHDPHGRSD